MNTGSEQTRRIMLVDDEPRNLALLEARLCDLGCELQSFTSAADAIASFDDRQPDLVLLDLVMPGLGGLDVLAHIRKHPRGEHVPVILVTAHSERHHRVRGLQAGADEFLEKPIDGPLLVARVQTLLRLKQSRDELQRSRDSLSVRNELLERLQRDQRELVQFIVHDLKTPLAIVTANLRWARENVSAQNLVALADALDDASVCSDRVRSMIEDLLTVSRLEDAALPMRLEALPLREFLREIISSCARQAAAKGIAVSLREGSEQTIRADSALLRRVIENVLENSLRYTPVSGVIAISCTPRPEGVVEIALCNNGPAIPASDRERIFDKFVRGTSDACAGGSAGLGLYFCKRAIEAHHGTIRVTETKEWPACFVVHLPAWHEHSPQTQIMDLEPVA
jgi:two-component system, sensor histidine kinase and response regulator